MDVPRFQTEPQITVGDVVRFTDHHDVPHPTPRWLIVDVPDQQAVEPLVSAVPLTETGEGDVARYPGTLSLWEYRARRLGSMTLEQALLALERGFGAKLPQSQVETITTNYAKPPYTWPGQ